MKWRKRKGLPRSQALALPYKVLFLASFILVQYHRASSETAHEQDCEVQQADLWHLTLQATISGAKTHCCGAPPYSTCLNPNFIYFSGALNPIA